MITSHGFTRRRALSIVAGAAGFCALGAFAPPARMIRWQGEVMGAPAEIALWSHSESHARGAIGRIQSEIARYHRICSLFDGNSEISRLNRDGHLSDASPDLLALIRESLRLGDLSEGAFDISVQPIWRVYEAHFWSKQQIAPDIAARASETARSLVDYRRIEINARRVAFTRGGMAITLNGIAQGFITDRISDLLRNEGFDTAFVDLGEMRALGLHPDGRAWRVALRDPASGNVGSRSIDLSDAAIAVSGGYGTTFEPSGKFHHIFDPRTGASAAGLRDVAVIGPRATAADGLSTAIYVAGETKAPRLLAAFPGTRSIVTRADGEMVEIAGATT